MKRRVSALRRAFTRIAPLLVFVLATSADAASSTIVVASTTSTENSGLFDFILPMFEAASGIHVKVVAVGTGQAIGIAERGDADVLLVHDRASEEAFVRAGHGVERFEIMSNEFVLLGPSSDPAGVRGMRDAPQAFAKIAEAHAKFTSRGDDSGTHKAERRLWQAAGTDPRPASGTWYLETGTGMGQTLNTAAELDAYALSDEGTWLSFRNPQHLEVLVRGDPLLHNPYGVTLVNPKKHPHVNAAGGAAFIAWLRSEAGQRAIGSFAVDGHALFTPSTPGAASPPEPGGGATPGR